MAKKVVIDCDVGVDDAFALILAFHSPELSVKAVTGVNGNVPLDQVIENIQQVLSLIQPQEKPLIARGADQPLKGKTPDAHSVHGKNGLGGAKIERKEGEQWWRFDPPHAAELIPEMAHQYPNDVTLIAIGPLTNVALALQKDPEGMRKLKQIVIMGGAIRTKGNVTPHSEFNIFSDPLAAKEVFGSGLPITLVPLDVTYKVSLTSQWMEEEVIPLGTVFSTFVARATGYDQGIKKFRNREVLYLHDPLAVGVVTHPDLVKKERLAIRVETEEGDRYGQTAEVNLSTPRPEGRGLPLDKLKALSKIEGLKVHPEPRPFTPSLKTGLRAAERVKDGPMIDVCLEVDAKGFLELFTSRLT
jgi:inosine-uridine nucleoside N-ribohydrolase